MPTRARMTDVLDLLEHVEVGGIVTATRGWLDNELVTADLGEVAMVATARVVVSFRDQAHLTAYRIEGTAPIGRCTFQEEAESHTTFDPLTWLFGLVPACTIPSLTFLAEIHSEGLYLDPTIPSISRIHVVDGSTFSCSCRNSADLMVSGPLRDIGSWLTRREFFRNVSARVSVHGNPFLLGALAGLFGAEPGIALPHRLEEAILRSLSLVEDHRHLRDSNERLWRNEIRQWNI